MSTPSAKIRDRPFNLQGGGGVLFHSEFFFRTTRELEYLFFCRAKRTFFFQNLTLGYMTKVLNQIFFFPPPKSEFFFQQHWESEYFFLEKKLLSPSPRPLEVKWSVPKANRTIGFLKRNLNICSTTVKQNAYKALVRPLVEYTSPVWDPYRQTEIDRIEMVQRRAATYVTNSHNNRSSVNQMLEHLEWKSMEQRRKDARLTMMYKITMRK